MKMANECLPCIVRGSLDAARLATNDEALQQQVVKRILKILHRFDTNQPPPLMAREIQKAVREITGVEDPYAALKKKFNDFALDLVPKLKARCGNLSFEAAVRLCIAGNIIDFGTHTQISEQQVLETIDDAMSLDINGSTRALEKSCNTAENILWVADNAGEIVFDTLLLEKLAPDKIVYAVRGGMTQNDATMEDVQYTGIDERFKTMDTGAAIPGVILEYCSKAFLTAYRQADLIIAKGQGNLETLDHTDDRIFFLFKAKCPVVARYVGCQLGDTVILKGGY